VRQTQPLCVWSIGNGSAGIDMGRAQDRRCHGPASPTKYSKRLRKWSRNWDRPSGCHGMASGASFGGFHSEKWPASDQNLRHEVVLSRAGLGAQTLVATGESRPFLRQPSRAGLVSSVEDRAR
jgi:hypothetical protein